MEEQQLLAAFFGAIERDARISITHIGIYAAVLRYWQLSGRANPFRAYSYEIMRLAKITASRTYHTAIRDLDRYGYLKYEPSFKRNLGSRMFLLIENSGGDECGDCDQGRSAGVPYAVAE